MKKVCFIQPNSTGIILYILKLFLLKKNERTLNTMI